MLKKLTAALHIGLALLASPTGLSGLAATGLGSVGSRFTT
jgi:hypothetical protein